LFWEASEVEAGDGKGGREMSEIEDGMGFSGLVGNDDDMVPRSRLNAIERELATAEAKIVAIQASAGAEITRLKEELEKATSNLDVWRGIIDRRDAEIEHLKYQLKEAGR
jgi:hypothetical protein